MFRTRDFVLYFTVAVFLVMAIGVTTIDKFFGANSESSLPKFAETSSATFTAELLEPSGPSREERLLAMREKIAAGEGLLISEAASTPSPQNENQAVLSEPQSVDSPTEATSSQDAQEKTVRLCPQYVEYKKPWLPMGVVIEVVEGARLVYRELPQPVTANASGTPVLPINSREVLVQLPMRFGPAAVSSCLESDVIGIAKDGSLIRNGEIALYGVFGEGTQIGYALDGFPIYGISTQLTDVCGGLIENGQYRYHLKKDSKVILNCFAAPPAPLP